MGLAKNHTTETISVDFSCVSCDKIFAVSRNAKLFCGRRCQQDAQLIRYVRACVKDGRINQHEIQEAINVKFATALGKKGYYDESARRLSPELRRKIIERDNGFCRKCGKLGNEIDHVNGDSNDLGNLQLLCHDCHLEKTKASFVELTPEHERYTEIKARSESLWIRIKLVSPQRLCDDSENWNTLQKQMLSEQRQLLKKIKEDIDGIDKQEDAYGKNLVIQEINDLAELELQLEALELQKQAQLDEILTSEIKSKIKAIEVDFADSVQNVRENIAISRKRIKESVLQYGSTVAGAGFQVVWNRGRVSWDLKSLERYAESHPEIGEFRKTGSPFVSFRRINNDKLRED